MNDFESPAEKKIREAMQRGEFNDLPGKGKPLNLPDDAFVPEDLRLAYQVLANNGYAPDWIELGEEIERERAALEKELAPGSPAERRARFARLKGQFEALNRKIFEYNLRVPLPTLQKKRFQLPADLAQD